MWVCCPPDYKNQMRSQSRNTRNSTPAGRTLFGPFLAAKHSRVASCLPACLGCGAETNTFRSPTPCMHPSPHLFSTGLRLLAAAPTYTQTSLLFSRFHHTPSVLVLSHSCKTVTANRCTMSQVGVLLRCTSHNSAPVLAHVKRSCNARARAIYLALLHRHHLAPR